MFHYLYTNDMRIDNLQDKAVYFANMFLNDSLPSANEDKSLNNSGMTIGFYLNLKSKGCSAKLITQGDFRVVILNIIKKFQYPNPRTKDSFRNSVNDGINIAPLREVIKILFVARLSGYNDFYLSKLELENFIFFNSNVAKVNKRNSFDRYSLLKDIIKYREDGISPGYFSRDDEKEWNHKDRQLNELISILRWSGFISYENEKITLKDNNELSHTLKSELYDIINFNEFWDYEDLIYEEKLDVIQKSYFDYIDNGLEVYLQESPDFYNDPPVEITHTSSLFPLSKPFLLLAGISGTGKSRFVRQQAEQTGEYQLVAVRPDWHEPSDLLGYVSRLSGKAEYVMTDVLKFIVKAWQAVEKAGLITNNQVCGESALLEQVKPYWLCLDEMNLAPVEQYFADYLSVIETRKWEWRNNRFTYVTDALLSPTAWKDIDNFKEVIGVSDELWQFFNEKGIGIPFNLIVAGTVNMDETTHAFSRKVLDRALSFDFSKFYPNDFDSFFEPKTKPRLLSYPIYSQAIRDQYSEVSIEFLAELNSALKDTPFELAYRALNELLLSIASFNPENDQTLQAVWDDFVMTKVLPRIEGDEAKIGDVLEKLESILKQQLSLIWEGEGRPDLWRESLDGSTLFITCRSKPKLERMRNQLQERGMVSFW